MELRDKIVKAALEVFGELGYEKATIAQIVKKANSSKGGFYHHFQSKKQVLDEITNRYLSEVVDGCNAMLEDTDKDTIYQLNNVFLTVNNFKKQRLSSWKELINLYSHEDSESIRLNMWVKFVEVTTDIYHSLILKGIDEGLFNPSSPRALASMWCNEVTRLYGLINNIIASKGDGKLYDDFVRQAQFVEDTINHALGATEKIIFILEPTKQYLDMAIEMMHKMNQEQQ